MNHISTRNGPELRFIIPEHQLSFEHKVIDCYGKVMTEKVLKFELPHIENDLFDYVKLIEPIHFVAARINVAKKDDGYFSELSSHMSYEEQFRFAIEEMERYQIAKHAPQYDDMLYEDIASVLNFHHMSFVDLGHVNEWGFFKQGDFYKHLPMGKVW